MYVQSLTAFGIPGGLNKVCIKCVKTGKGSKSFHCVGLVNLSPKNNLN